MTEENLDLFRSQLAALKEEIKAEELDALIIPHDDEYLSGNLTPHAERISNLTGFTGSAGFVCISLHDPEEAEEAKVIEGKVTGKSFELALPQAVFVDGRYQVQVKEQVSSELFDSFNMRDISPAAWLSALLPKKSVVGIDLNCVSYSFYSTLKDDLAPYGIEVKGLNCCLFDRVWEDRPDPVCSTVQLYSDEFNGCPSMQKRKQLAKTLRDLNLDATVICNPEAVCWLLNIRGRDREFFPIINCRMVAYANEALEWYINFDHLTDEVIASLEDHAGHIDIFPESSFDDVLDRLSSSKCRIHIDPKTGNAHVLNELYNNGAHVVEGTGLCELPKACKNDTEIAGEQKAHIKDGLAMCRFLALLDDITRVDNLNDLESYQRRVEEIDEGKLASKAEGFRRIEGGFIESSFATISALGPNAAMCHYDHTEVSSPRKLGQDPLYLIDSGAHYEEGTTDVTRTVLVGPGLTEEMQRMYTLVLKAHIALASTVFPYGTCGMQLDAIARRPLWAEGADYDHGTGHGVGHLLSVHEGPQVISAHSSTVPLEPGMVISVEPGYYREDHFGIRLENLVVVTKCSAQGCRNMLCFEPLTLVPFDNRLILREMLSPSERAWLNEYHQNVYSIIKNAGTTLSDMEVSYLTKATAPI